MEDEVLDSEVKVFFGLGFPPICLQLISIVDVGLKDCELTPIFAMNPGAKFRKFSLQIST
jgi:hypothetical protein